MNTNIMEKLAMTSSDLQFMRKRLIARILLSLLGSTAVAAMAWLLAKEGGANLSLLVILLIAIVLGMVIFFSTSRQIVRDLRERVKTIEQKKVQKPNEDGLFKSMTTPVAERCTQKQSFGSNADSAPRHNEMKVDGDKIVLPQELYEKLDSGDYLLIFRALHSRILLDMKQSNKN